MKKCLKNLALCCIVFILCFQVGFAQSVDVATAKLVANNYYKANAQIDNSVGADVDLNVLETKSYRGENLYYVFGKQNDVGFVIVAADYASTPVLAYSDKSSYAIQSAEKAPAFIYWMAQYEQQLQEIKEKRLEATQDIEREWTAWQRSDNNQSRFLGVTPLVNTTWNQSPYYNALCPGGSVTGCVATAMAQVMKRWNFPAQGTGSHCYIENNYGNLCANFGTTTYNWTSMPNNVTSTNNAVATLMYHCGVSVDMDYSLSSSTAWVHTSALNAFKTYFGYDQSITYLYRSNYTTANWLIALKGQLNAGRPMIYVGYQGTSIGHAWVCDGYNDNNLFHMNWGWGGYSDGYFSVDALNAGGYSFNNSQGVLANIFPVTSSCPANLNFTAAVASGDYEATSTITASNTISVGQDVEYDAGSSITLQPGFWAQSGSIFHAVIEGCGGIYLPPPPPDNGDVVQTAVAASTIVNGFTISPNPTTGLITISSEAPIPRIQVFDMMGRTIQVLETNDDRNVEVNLSSFPNGIYFILADGLPTQRVIKQ
ncbi:MAG: thiol protease/hemagglutinin PrtT [Saprospiraceae bacterium]|nr:thiol protease/hemagglutinin PrtT [Saprospiraceae bacterium]MBP7679962.1 thiol protease/hemagglutinin PrtT [Saprospiraceae bacterium]